MESLSFGIGIVFPVFFVISLGALLRIRGLVDENFMSQASSLVFYWALPVKLFLDIYRADLSQGLPGKFTLAVVLLTLATFGLAWILAVFLIPRSQRSAFVHAGFRSNFVYVGYPIISSLLGSTSWPAVVSVNLFILTLYNFLAILVLTYYQKEGQGIRGLVYQTLKNPMVLASLLGLAYHLLFPGLPKSLEEGLGIFGSLASPLALLLVGMQLGQSLRQINPGALLSGAFCVLVRPLICLPILHLLPLSYQEFAVAFVLFTTPCAVNAYVMTKKMGGDEDFAAQAIFVSFFLSLITYPLILALMNKIGWIYSL